MSKNRKRLVFGSTNGKIYPKKELMEPEPSDFGCSQLLAGTVVAYKKGSLAITVHFIPSGFQKPEVLMW